MAKRSWISQIAQAHIPQGYPPSVRRACTRALRELLTTAARIARNPYGDEVRVIGREEPASVGEKIAAAIEKLGRREKP